MKNTFTTIISLFLFTFNLQAQKIYFSDTTNSWLGIHVSASGPTAVESRRYGYSYLADTVIKNAHFRIMMGGDGVMINTAAIREDTLQRKVYFRFLTSQFRNNPTDTAEHLLYDYNLKVNDTFRVDYSTNHYVSVVYAIDSTFIQGRYYKTWSFNSTLSMVVEGLGSTKNPLWPIASWIFEDDYQIQCFSNKFNHPSIYPALPVSAGPYPVTIGPPSTSSFDNATSCTLGIDFYLINDHSATVVPNPGGDNQQLQIVNTIINGRLTIYNSIGQKVEDIKLKNANKVDLGRLLPGVYYYRISANDKTDQSIQSGRFVHQ